MVFSKVHPACHNIANGIKPGSYSKKNDRHASDCSKAVCMGCKVIYVRCINCSYNNAAKGIHLLYKKAIFFYRKNFMQVRAVESYTPLSKSSKIS